MDLATHAFTSLALARGLFPRRSWPFTIAFVFAGVLADVDLLTLLFGPSAYLTGHDTVTHSLIGTVVVIGIAVLFVKLLPPRSGSLQKAGPADTRFSTVIRATSLAAVVHLLLDVVGTSGVVLLWPFPMTRFAWDWLPFLDPWVLVILVSGIALPELLSLVGSEIGAKEKAPRGRNGALMALALVVIYSGARMMCHNNAIAQLDAHSYRGESPRKVAAFPDSLSMITWHGVVETASQVCTVDVPVMGAARFDAETAACVHKPEDSPALRTAQGTTTAQNFLQAARFPRASVGVTQAGSEVVIRDMRDAAQANPGSALAARVLLDRKGQVNSQSLVWAREVKLR